MNNPLFGGMQQTPNPVNPNISGLLQRFNQFRQAFSGDPRQQVQQLLNSGRISQAQYNNAYQMAQQLQRMLGK